MDDPWKAHAAIDALSKQASAEICDRSSSIEDASGLLMRLVQTVQLNVQLGVMAPEFQKRVFERHQRLMAAKIVSETGLLTIQLEKLGIDPDPVFSDLPPGVD